MTITCPSHQYEHYGQCCDLCPPGKYVVDHCRTGSATVCKTCSHDSYTDERNGLNKCLSCKQCHTDQRELKPCQEHSDRQCECKTGLYCSASSMNHCDHCRPVQTCPPGEGVSALPTSTKDTVCRPCTAGTFSSVEDYQSPCNNHTNCGELGRRLLTPGTANTDAKCGDFIPSCHWILPAGLWVGLFTTILVCAVIALLYRRAKLKTAEKQKTEDSISPEWAFHSSTSPVFPPDIIKHPRSPELQTLFHKDEIFSNTDCSLECDGITTTTMTASEKNGPSTGLFQYGGFTTTDPSILQSEPQEDEWHGA